MTSLYRWVRAKLNRLSCVVPPPPDASPKRVLIIHCHPSSAETDSLARQLETAVLKGLARHEVRLRRLYGDTDPALAYGERPFDPVLSSEEKASYADPELVRRLESAETAGAGLPKDVASAVEDLRWCDSLVFIYPTWWFSFPAVLKGYFDRSDM